MDQDTVFVAEVFMSRAGLRSIVPDPGRFGECERPTLGLTLKLVAFGSLFLTREKHGADVSVIDAHFEAIDLIAEAVTGV